MGKNLAEQEFSFDSDWNEIMSLEDDNEDEKAKIKALPLIDSSAELIEIDDIKADENDSRSTLHFLSSYLLFM